MMGACDVSPRRGGLLHTSTAPQRRRHCGIAKAALLVCSLEASDGNNHVSICSGCADLGVGGGGPSWWMIELFCLCEIFACCVRYLTDGRNTPGTKSVPKVSPRIDTISALLPASLLQPLCIDGSLLALASNHPGRLPRRSHCPASPYRWPLDRAASRPSSPRALLLDMRWQSGRLLRCQSLRTVHQTPG